MHGEDKSQAERIIEWVHIQSERLMKINGCFQKKLRVCTCPGCRDEKTLELFLVVSLLYKFQRVNIDEDVLLVEIWSWIQKKMEKKKKDNSKLRLLTGVSMSRKIIVS